MALRSRVSVVAKLCIRYQPANAKSLLVQRTFAFDASQISKSYVPRDVPAESPAREKLRKFLTAFLPVSGLTLLAYAFLNPEPRNLFPAFIPYQEGEELANWSGTHHVSPKRHYTPTTREEVEQLVAQHHQSGQRLRVVGSALSPNGIAFSDEGMMSMALLDKILHVDQEKQQVRVQAGCRVQQVADALKPHGLTLQNYASVREQQIGGFVQVSAHGTGATIPPVDNQVVSMRLVTPAGGPMEVNGESNPELFEFAKVGLGALGVVTELTLQCVPSHHLVEQTFTASPREVRRNHGKWLKENRHVRYMWVPFTNTVVVVMSNPVKGPEDMAKAHEVPLYNEDERLAPLRELLAAKSGTVLSPEVLALGFAELRDELLALAPLDQAWVVKVNKAEAEYWKRSAGWRVGTSDEILGFDCGGQQWVLEVALPTQPLNQMATHRWQVHPELDYMDDLMRAIKRHGIPAHTPIEQRWTATSSSPLSPASHHDTSMVHSWVGVIMYLPTEDEGTREAITKKFREYGRMIEQQLMPKYSATWHWAKIEPPEDPKELQAMKSVLANRYPLDQYNQLRAVQDPKNILSNRMLDILLT